MKPPVTIVDYGVSNLLNVVRAFEHCGASVILAENSEQIAMAERLVLPGVGAFADGMSELHARSMVGPLRAYAMTGRPFLGICLGMQMMLESSEEFGYTEGLGLIPGKVIAIPVTAIDGRPHKVPHIGWNELLQSAEGPSWAGSILQGVPVGAPVYFVHSFMAVPASGRHRLADCSYDGQILSAAIQSGVLYGCQFHPEKSGETGLQVIRHFLRLRASP